MKNRNPPEQRLRCRPEQSVTPCDGVPQAPLPQRSLETAAARQGQAVFELGQELARRKHRYPCGCQLNRQGQSVQPLADAHDGLGIGAGERKFGIKSLSTIDEEATSVEFDCLCLGTYRPYGRQRKRSNIE